MKLYDNNRYGRYTNGRMLADVMTAAAAVLTASDAASVLAGGIPYFFYDGMAVFFICAAILLRGAADCFAGFRAWSALPVYDARRGPLLYDGLYDGGGRR